MNKPEKLMLVAESQINEAEANENALIDFEIEELESRITLNEPEPDTTCASASASTCTVTWSS